jgi:hypothetical protein
MNDNIKNQLLALPKDVPIVFFGYGFAGEDADAIWMAQALADLNAGFTDIRVLTGGYTRWLSLATRWLRPAAEDS